MKWGEQGRPGLRGYQFLSWFLGLKMCVSHKHTHTHTTQSITGSTTGILYETNLISKYQAALSTRSKLFTGRTEQSEFSTPLVTIQIVFQTPGHDSFDNAVTRSIKDTVVDFVTPK